MKNKSKVLDVFKDHQGKGNSKKQKHFVSEHSITFIGDNTGNVNFHLSQHLYTKQN